MDKQLLPSIEKFAAYIEGNLSQDEMLQFSNMAARNEDLMLLLDANDTIEETLASYDEVDLMLPEEIAGMDFDLPEIKNVDAFNLEGDSLSENKSLYQQEGFHDVENILDDVFDDNVLETEYSDDIDFDFDSDILDPFN